MLSEPLRSDFPAKSGGKAERSLLCEESRVISLMCRQAGGTSV